MVGGRRGIEQGMFEAQGSFEGDEGGEGTLRASAASGSSADRAR
jgi:hypothetical protein